MISRVCLYWKERGQHLHVNSKEIHQILTLTGLLMVIYSMSVAWVQGSTVDDIAPDGNGCYTNDTHSVLELSNTGSGSHLVQCILEQNIRDDFKNDPSFQ